MIFVCFNKCNISKQKNSILPKNVFERENSVNMGKIVVLTGAGISAESGISTFRDAGGLWEGHDVMEVASPGGWEADMGLVLDFYNQ